MLELTLGNRSPETLRMIYWCYLKKESTTKSKDSRKKCNNTTDTTKSIWMLKEASGYGKYPSGYQDEASWCLRLPDPETSKNRDATGKSF